MKRTKRLLICILFITCLLIPNPVWAKQEIEIEIEEIPRSRYTLWLMIMEQTESTSMFSDTIKVEVTKDEKEKIEEQLLELDNEIKMLAKLIYREARGIKQTEHKAGVVWCVLNRVDNEKFDDNISDVITARHQFAWVSNTPVKEEFYELSKDVVTRWLLEKEGHTDVGRVLPQEYLFFAGRRGLNYFRKNYRSNQYWDWSLNTPYTIEEGIDG